MTTHYVQHPLTRQNLHFGRNRPKPRARRFLSTYKAGTSVALPTAPSSFDFTGVGGGTLYPGLSDVLANDSLGDCTAAGALHIVDSWTARAGAPACMTADDAVLFYELSTGYKVGQPATDQGGDEVTVLSTWQLKGLDGSGKHAIVGWIDVNPSDMAEVRALLYLFGNLYFGVELPDSWTQSMPSGNGFTWPDGAPDPNQGHCFVGLGASPRGILIDTWGLVGTVEDAAVEHLCSDEAGGQLICAISQEALAGARLAEPGIDWDALVADARAEGMQVAAASQP